MIDVGSLESCSLDVILNAPFDVQVNIFLPRNFSDRCTHEIDIGLLVTAMYTNIFLTRFKTSFCPLV